MDPADSLALAGRSALLATAAPLPAVLFDAAVSGLARAVGHLHLHVVVDLSTPLERRRVEEALADLVGSFPVLGCRYVERGLRDQWVPDPSMSVEDAVTVVDPGTGTEGATAELVKETLDPGSGWPLRVAIVPRAEGSRLVVSLLHQVVDGAGALTVVRELGSRLFAAGRSAPEPQPMARGIRELLRAIPLAKVPGLIAACLVELLRPLQLPLLTRTALRRAASPPSDPSPVYRTVEVDASEDSPLRALCRRRSCTVNDALVAALALMVAGLGPRGLLGSFFTVDLRRYLPDEVPRLTNLTGAELVILSRRSASSFERALDEVAHRTARRKRALIGIPFFANPTLSCLLLPHSLIRGIAATFGGVFMTRLINRGLLVTNIGPMDEYLEPFGEAAVGGTVIGPFLRGVRVPAITATGFRDRVTLQLGGYDDLEPAELDRVAGLLRQTLEVER